MGQKPPNHHIQLQQKLIYYRAEIAKYEQQVKALETELQKEKLRNEFLLEKLHDVESVYVEPYEKKIAELEQQLLSYEVALEEAERQIQHLKKLKYTVQEDKKQAVVKAQALFAYSTLLPETPEEETLVIGDFIIQNIGTEALQNLIVCLRVRPKLEAELSGKIATYSTRYDDPDSIEWIFAYENWRERIKNDGEYWIKPIHLNKLLPNEELRLANMHIRIKKTANAPSTVIDGFVYGNELPNGIASLNSIIINT